GRYAPPALRSGGGGGVHVVAGLLVLGDEIDATLMAILAREWLGEEDVDQLLQFLLGVLTGADGDHVGVVVLTGQARGVLVPHQGRADAAHLVGGDLLAVAGAADHHAQGSGVADHGLADVGAEGRVVVEGVVLVSAVVGDLVPLRPQCLHEPIFERETCVSGTYWDVHGFSFSVGSRYSTLWSTAAPRDRLTSMKPVTDVIASIPCSRRSASSPRGAGETTGSKYGVPSPKEI